MGGGKVGPVVFEVGESLISAKLSVPLEVKESGLLSSLELKDNKLAFRVGLHFSAEGFRELGGRPLVLQLFPEVEGETVVAIFCITILLNKK